MIGERPIHGRAPSKRGAVWPRGSELRDMLASPGLVSQDGSIQIVSGPTGTALDVAPMPPMRAVREGDGTWTIAAAWYYWDGADATAGRATWRFAAVTAEAYVTLYYIGWYHVYDAPHLYWSCDALTPLDSATTNGRAPSVVTTSHTGRPFAARLAIVRLSPTGKATWIAATARLVGSVPATCPGYWVLPHPHEPLSVGWNPASVPVITVDGAFGYSQVAIPAGTDDDVWVRGRAGYAPRELRVGAPSAGYWGWPILHVHSSATGQLTRIEAMHGLLAMYGGLIPSLAGMGTASANFQTADGKTVVVTNGIITSVT